MTIALRFALVAGLAAAHHRLWRTQGLIDPPPLPMC